MGSFSQCASPNTSHFFPFYLSWSDVTRCRDLSFLIVEFQASIFTLIKRLFNSSLSAISGIICISEVVDISPGNLDSSS